jgi:Spy/CpxP family protein refolding chaperone
MTPVRPSFAAAACAFWLSAIAFGQPPATSAVSAGPFSNPYGRSFQWLANPQVQEELQLTDDQWGKIKQAQEEMSKKMRELYRSKDISERDPRKREQAIRERTRALSDEAEDKARAILSPEQAERLQQIIRQMQMGWGSQGIAGVLLDSDVGAKLRLTREQQGQLRQRQAEVFQENNRKVQAFYRQLRAETREKLFAVLTAEQRKNLETLLGPKFEFKPAAEAKEAGGPAAKVAKPKP